MWNRLWDVWQDMLVHYHYRRRAYFELQVNDEPMVVLPKEPDSVWYSIRYGLLGYQWRPLLRYIWEGKYETEIV